MQYRHEWKHEISAFDVLCLRRRFSAVMAPDPHASGGRRRSCAGGKVGRISARCDPGSGADPLHPQRGLFQVRGLPGVWIT